MSESAVSAREPNAGPRVAILLSTYNGAKFLAEQIDSLLRQTYSNWILLVRDDGSTDATVAILADYASRYPQKVHRVEDDSANRGASSSFSLLCEYAQGNKEALGLERVVACFCDQDDVWSETKIEAGVSALLRAEADDKAKPVMVHSDLRVVDEELVMIAPSFARYQGLETERRRFANLAISNLVTGCTALFNEALLDLALPVPKRAIMHDWWFAMSAAAFGELVYLPEPSIDYRQHGANTIGAKPHRLGEDTQAGFVARVLRLERNAHLVEVAIQAREFARHFSGRLTPQQRLALWLCSKMRTQSPLLQRTYYRLARRC